MHIPDIHQGARSWQSSSFWNHCCEKNDTMPTSSLLCKPCICLKLDHHRETTCVLSPSTLMAYPMLWFLYAFAFYLGVPFFFKDKNQRNTLVSAKTPLKTFPVVLLSIHIWEFICLMPEKSIPEELVFSLYLNSMNCSSRCPFFLQLLYAYVLSSHYHNTISDPYFNIFFMLLFQL